MSHPHHLLTRGRICTAALCATSLFITLAGCSMYHTLDAKRHTWRGLDETDGHYGQPYYLPKAMIHLVVKADTSGGNGNGGNKDTTNSGATPSVSGGGTNTNNFTVNVDGQTVSTDASTNKQEGKRDPVTGALLSQNTTPAPVAGAAAALPGGPALPAASTPAPTPKFDAAPTKYTITIEMTIVPDMTSGPYYAHYSPNWFYEEDAQLGINEKTLLATADFTSSDKTAQVIYNLADTAVNIAKFASTGGASAFASARLAHEEAPEAGDKGRVVTYKKMDIDVRFDPLDPVQVAKLKSFFNDVETSQSVYVSPFSVDIVEPAGVGITIGGKYPLNEKGLYFREPMPIEVHVVGREEVFRRKVQREMNNSTGKPHDTLVAQLKAVNELGGHHTERLAFAVPNKNRVYAFNIARSSFVTQKKTTLTVSDGQLTNTHFVHPSEALGFSEIPLTLSQKLADLPSGILTYRQDITTKQGAVTAAQKTSFNNSADLQDAIANRDLAKQKARLDAQAARDQSAKAAADAAAALPAKQ